MRASLKILGGIAVYHLAVGATYAWMYAQVNEPKNATPEVFIKMTVAWPIYAAGTVYMDHRWNDVMTDVGATLDELNSGRWERIEKKDQP